MRYVHRGGYSILLGEDSWTAEAGFGVKALSLMFMSISCSVRNPRCLIKGLDFKVWG
jgi:hypothetical protein